MATSSDNLMGLAGRVFLGQPASAWTDGGDPERTQGWIRRNQLGPLLFLASRFGDLPEAIRAGLPGYQQAYLAGTQVNAYRFQAALDLAEVLEQAGIPCLCYRGPFSGLQLYGDFATRPFQDVDLIVPMRQTEAAWQAVRESGYRLLQPEMPRGFFRRHHIHWTVVKDSSLVDLHWQVEHPYTNYKIEYDPLFRDAVEVEAQGHRWKQPSAEHLLLLMCLQLTKHEPDALALAMHPDAAAHLLDQALFWKWMDIALQVQREGETLDWPAVFDTAARWRGTTALHAGLAGCQRILGLSLPDGATQGLDPTCLAAADASAYSPEPDHASLLGDRLSLLLFKLGGFRASRLRDFGAYLWPPADYFEAPSRAGRGLQRGGHLLVATGRMALAGLDGAFCFSLAGLRRRWRALHDRFPTAERFPTRRMITRRTSP